MKRGMIAMVLAGLCAMMAGAAEVRNVTAEQRWSPWDGKVQIQYEVVGEVPAQAWLAVTATDLENDVSCVAIPGAISGDTGNEEGVHRIVWDMGEQAAFLQSDHVEFTVAYDNEYNKRRYPSYGVFSIIDLSSGAYSQSYPVTCVTNLPGNDIDFNTDEYKTTKLVLRRIEPGAFTMCGEYEVTLTNPFYMGIFEVTQKQYELVAGGNPSSYKGDMRPVEKFSWNTIRGGSWPSPSTVDANSFVGRLRARTGLDFDLPTEAQWEYACRAAMTNTYNSGAGTEDALRVLGRYGGNRFDGKGGYSEHTTVGSYMPNAWGLYDMHGNVWEWCLDWYGSLTNGVTNPAGSSSGSYRGDRGGSWSSGASECTSSYRGHYQPSKVSDSLGFRLVRTLSE